MAVKTEYKNMASYTTMDGSIVRELFQHDIQGNTNQSLAEAIVPIGFMTLLHRHHQTEEISRIPW